MSDAPSSPPGPPARHLGAKELGVDIRWRHRFVPPGTRAAETPGVLYLDVGGGLGPGVLDHHGDSARPTSTAELILQHRELVYVHLLGPLLERAAAGEDVRGATVSLTLVTHFAPDFDGVTSTYLVRHLIEHGDVPVAASALARYVTDVDQGRYRVELDRRETFFAPHIAQLAVQNLPFEGTRHAGSERTLERGLELIARVLDDIGPTWDPRSFAPEGDHHPATRWAEDARFEDVRELLEAEPEMFAADYEEATRETALLPPEGGSGAPVEVPVFIGKAPPKSKLNKYWVRASGYPYFVCPYATPRDVPEDPGPLRYGRVILSLDPTWRHPLSGEKPSLRGLGFALERAECEARAALPHGDDRPPTPRWDDGTCDNADPWYDGRGHAFTIVDAPAATTVLDYEVVRGIATGGDFWHVPLARGTVTLMRTADLDDAGDAATSLAGAWAPMKCPDGIDDRLQPFYEACRAKPVADADLGVPGVVAKREMRDFPDEARGGLELLHVEAAPGATLEQLIAGMHAAIQRFGKPDYALSRIRLGPHNADPARLDGLVRELGDVEVDELPLAKDELVLFNHRSLLVRALGDSRAVENDGYLEVLFYLAFVREALRDYRTRLSDLLRAKTRDRKKTDELRRDVLAFQTRYYDLEIARGGRARRVSERLVDAMHLVRSYGEIQDQMRQLAQLEAREEALVREKADIFMETALFFVAAAGVFETIVAFLSWDGFDIRTDWEWLVPIIGLLVVIWVIALTLRLRRRRK